MQSEQQHPSRETTTGTQQVSRVSALPADVASSNAMLVTHCACRVLAKHCTTLDGKLAWMFVTVCCCMQVQGLRNQLASCSAGD
jgi:hypothetical protein